ncbi:PhzF family phenazine biosynthesis protein [Idiomarina sp. HP20-50]|uniref:PhzF family phenazine biosynthesis protein n=1 Tax=Idiomarina sp. HP20-50 TaxID=3070813 RepID=UPI00294AA5E0|nr:PhzF family phenazine biosynthesis protein [Idiomarina sp. HP20-50]MDV6316434.1 PhzF family phenazine biosynthesis protein [Idiomarina sp. HP20-50]
MSGHDTLCTVDVFYGPRAQGNQHHILYRADPDWYEIPAEHGNTPNLILLSGGDGVFTAQFFSCGQPTYRCGSGNLAIATYIDEELASAASNWRLLTDAGEIQLGVDRQSAYYLDKALAQRPLQNRNFWQRLVRQPVINGRYCGHRNDYVLLEVSQPLIELNINSPALRRFSQRALIVVYRPPSGAVQLRYFAPQYGPAEDAATGSASVQAASYLRQQYPKRYAHQPLQIQQCSPAGGYLYLTGHQQQTLVRGRTAVRRKGANHSSFVYTNIDTKE